MVYSQRNSVWRLRRNRNLSVLFYDVIYDTLRENMLEINMNIWLPHLKEHFNQQIQNTEFTVFSMVFHHRIASETIGYHCRWQHQNLMIDLTFLSCLKCVKLLQTTDLHNRFLTCNSSGLCLLLMNLCILLTRSAFCGNHRQDLLLLPKVQRIGVWSHPALLRSANVFDKDKWDWTVTQPNSAVPQLREESETLKSKHLCLQKN